MQLNRVLEFRVFCNEFKSLTHSGADDSLSCILMSHRSQSKNYFFYFLNFHAMYSINLWVCKLEVTSNTKYLRKFRFFKTYFFLSLLLFTIHPLINPSIVIGAKGDFSEDFKKLISELDATSKSVELDRSMMEGLIPKLLLLTSYLNNISEQDGLTPEIMDRASDVIFRISERFFTEIHWRNVIGRGDLKYLVDVELLLKPILASLNLNTRSIFLQKYLSLLQKEFKDFVVGEELVEDYKIDILDSKLTTLLQFARLTDQVPTVAAQANNFIIKALIDIKKAYPLMYTPWKKTIDKFEAAVDQLSSTSGTVSTSAIRMLTEMAKISLLDNSEPAVEWGINCDPVETIVNLISRNTSGVLPSSGLVLEAIEAARSLQEYIGRLGHKNSGYAKSSAAKIHEALSDPDSIYVKLMRETTIVDVIEPSISYQVLRRWLRGGSLELKTMLIELLGTIPEYPSLTSGQINSLLSQSVNTLQSSRELSLELLAIDSIAKRREPASNSILRSTVLLPDLALKLRAYALRKLIDQSRELQGGLDSGHSIVYETLATLIKFSGGKRLRPETNSDVYFDRKGCGALIFSAMEQGIDLLKLARVKPFETLELLGWVLERGVVPAEYVTSVFKTYVLVNRELVGNGAWVETTGPNERIQKRTIRYFADIIEDWLSKVNDNDIKFYEVLLRSIIAIKNLGVETIDPSLTTLADDYLDRLQKAPVFTENRDRRILFSEALGRRDSATTEVFVTRDIESASLYYSRGTEAESRGSDWLDWLRARLPEGFRRSGK